MSEYEVKTCVTTCPNLNFSWYADTLNFLLYSLPNRGY
ncbi:MAG: hypothetical protein H6Q18_892, partial [Bacteroidetes bacterium]|nr:hypothetical protein [Bacteroidota bacterium]